MLRMRRQQVEQISTPPQLRYYKQLIIYTKNIEEPNHIIMPPQLPQHIHLLLQLGNILRIIPQHYAFASKLLALARLVGMVSLGLAAGGYADLSIGPLANDQVTVEEVRGTTLRGVQGGRLCEIRRRRRVLRGRGNIVRQSSRVIKLIRPLIRRIVTRILTATPLPAGRTAAIRTRSSIAAMFLLLPPTTTSVVAVGVGVPPPLRICCVGRRRLLSAIMRRAVRRGVVTALWGGASAASL
mmetsp:Transcript_13059/g.23986  ORF Transcript_13059/g.23986 Transcript_13059/m.23986 type:complete len:240 (+) Transcript_13059:955-1674(+)